MEKKQVFSLLNMITRSELFKFNEQMEAQRDNFQSIEREYGVSEKIENPSSEDAINFINFGAAETGEYELESISFRNTVLKDLNITAEAATAIVEEVLKMVSIKNEKASNRVSEEAKNRLQNAV